MTTINRSALVPYAAAEMYALVDDINAYQDFLPWCKASHVLSRGDNEVRAELRLVRGGFEKSFVTRNRSDNDQMIEMSLEQGPFHHLEGIWRFDSLDAGACKVSLHLDFEFSNKLLGFTFGPVFNQIANTLVDAFCRRAEVIYGKR